MFIVVNNMAQSNLLDISHIRILSVFVIFSQGAKFVLDWMRLFDNTSFYVTLILKTIIDI